MSSIVSLSSILSLAMLLLLVVGSSSSVPIIVNAQFGGGFFYQVICSDAACSTDCQYDLFNEDVCYIMSNGESGYGQCVDNRQTLLQVNYGLSTNCTGISNTDTVPSGKCSPSGNQFVKFNCNTGDGNKDDKENKILISNDVKLVRRHDGAHDSKGNKNNNIIQRPPRLHLASLQKNSKKNVKVFDVKKN